MSAPFDQLIDDVGQYAWFALPRAVISAAMVVAAVLVYGRSRLRSAAGAAAAYWGLLPAAKPASLLAR